MTKDAVATMGTILDDDVGGRDAVHVAVIAVRAGERLKPGTHVGLRSTSSGEFLAVVKQGPIGIVDPFLTDPVQSNQRFWLYLYPRSITSLRHNWTHPAFPNEETDQVYAAPVQKLISEYWLRAFCEKNDCPDYEQLIATIKRTFDGEPHYAWGDDGTGYLHIGGFDAHGAIPPEFWDHVETVLGTRVPIERRAKYFSCSC